MKIDYENLKQENLEEGEVNIKFSKDAINAKRSLLVTQETNLNKELLNKYL